MAAALAAPSGAAERADDLGPVPGGIAASTGLPGDGTEIPTTYSVVEREAVEGGGRGAGRATAPVSAATGGIGVGGQPTLVPLTPGSGSAPSLAMTRLPAEGATPNAYLELSGTAQQGAPLVEVLRLWGFNRVLLGGRDAQAVLGLPMRRSERATLLGNDGSGWLGR